MGEQANGKLYFSVNGVDYTELIGIPTATLETTETPSERKINILNGGCFTFRIKTPKVLRCRSRKRFVKLLMSIGVPRNVAYKVKATAGQSYSSLWWYVAMTNLCCCEKR